MSAQQLKGVDADMVAASGALKLFINGDFVEAASLTYREVINPFSEKVLAKAPEASAEDVEAAAAAAQKAQAAWAKLGGAKRAEYMRAIAKDLVERKAELSELETLNNGKPFPEAEWDLDDCAACFNYYASLAEELDGDRGCKTVDVGDADYACTIRQESAGVAGLVLAFNYPLLLFCWKVCPAIAAGCTCVVKPSEYTPLTVLALGRTLQKVGLPPGVVNIVTGSGPTGAAMVASPQIDVLSLTGSPAAGASAGSEAARRLKKMGLELGGHSAAIVHADAALDKAAEWVCFGSWWTNGQICSSTTRLLIDESIADDFIAKLKAIGEKIRMGDPMDKETKLGPVISRKQQAHVLGLVDRAVAEGAERIFGEKPASGKGFFIPPTILRLASGDRSNVAWTDEIFGPVLVVQTFASEEEAIELANDSKYGLAGAVFSSDEAKLDRATRGLKAGIVWNNCSQPCFCQLPWGGRKLSGVGRDLGEYGLSNYLEPKQVVQYKSDAPLGWYC
ncbi:Aldehyde dehydrogenase [Hondaea fermentalgiana]|uniref:Aldehyde dehydrogenase n=1 Tax=Hondaea fermentalgiana TaxID=2315210 RepID=A0A2R5G314_9STRA|nr:Aldehyde dehydrogenase [Hondaea fermentalgiana]|eukprot:GBG25400.1 Aldehyde dehydrogenase [Hondaea fermentalgiana]